MSLPKTLALLGFAAVVLAAQTPPASPAAARQPGLYATMVTSMGPIVLQLYEAESPITVKNFIDLQKGRKPWKDPKTGQTLRRPLYTGTTFHRAIPGFMIQGGDPAGNGTGEVGFTIKDEFSPRLEFDRAGRLAMANIGEPNTGACQFFITTVATPHLNRKHTIFGQVVEGQDVVFRISQAKRNSQDKPLTAVVIKSLTFERVGPAPANDPLGPARPAAAKPKAAAPKAAAPKR
jgi:peptidyl-prolyl cis-trans isomerase A (cyclophilin A)